MSRLVGKTIVFQSVGGKHEISFYADNGALELWNTRGAAGQASRRGTWKASDGRICFDIPNASRCYGLLKDGDRLKLVELGGSYKGIKHSIVEIR